MMLTSIRASIVCVALAATCTAASAASLQVAPTTLEIGAGSKASTLILKNTGVSPIKAQVRVYRWSFVNGEERLEPTTDVVASPPMSTIKPNMDYTVRLVRLSKQPVTVEESYRLLIDEIVDPTKRAGGTITMAFQYRIPAFFLPASATKGDVQWSYERRDGKMFVSATNTGGRRVRIADLVASDGKGKPIVVAKGLAGYVLARSSKSWVAPKALQNAAQPLLITAQSESGPINAQAYPQPAR